MYFIIIALYLLKLIIAVIILSSVVCTLSRQMLLEFAKCRQNSNSNRIVLLVCKKSVFVNILVNF